MRRVTSIVNLVLAWSAVALAAGCQRPGGDRPRPAAHAEGVPAAPAQRPAWGPATALIASLAPYPSQYSDAGKADVAIVLWLQRTRSAADVDRARAEAALGLDTFAEALGPGFDAAGHPRTCALFAEAGQRIRSVVGEAKRRFGRPRPYDADPRVTPAVGREPSFAYPSGHAAAGLVQARVLAELAPDRRDRLVAVGLRVGYDRVVGGVHYPSDVTAGQQLGVAIADALLADPEMQRMIEDVRAAEWTDTVPVRPTGTGG